LPAPEIDEVSFLNALRDLEENGLAVSAKLLRRERTIVVHFLCSPLVALTDGRQRQANVTEGLHKAKFDQVAKTKFDQVVAVGIVRSP